MVTAQMLAEPGEAVVLLPAMTRYEQPGGGTETTTERRIVFSPEIQGPRVGEARSEWEIFVDLARRVDPERARLVAFDSAQQIREEIARVVPLYAGIERLAKTGPPVQWGGGRRCDGGVFPTARGKAHLISVGPQDGTIPGRRLLRSTRRGQQLHAPVFQP